jgi:transposase
MTPHSVYIPTGQVRQLRRLLSRRAALVAEQTAWRLRARSYLQAAGRSPNAGRSVAKIMSAAMSDPLGMDSELHEAVALCERMEKTLGDELSTLEKILFAQAKEIDEVKRLMTIPAVGIKVATVIYAWVGDVSRFPDARSLASYAGLVPSVHQSGASSYNGRITKQGSSELRRVLTQAGHVLLWRCQNEDSIPLKRIAERVNTSRGRRKIAVVAAARHILRLAYYILRDGTTYDPTRLMPKDEEVDQAAA